MKGVLLMYCQRHVTVFAIVTVIVTVAVRTRVHFNIAIFVTAFVPILKCDLFTSKFLFVLLLYGSQNGFLT